VSCADSRNDFAACVGKGEPDLKAACSLAFSPFNPQESSGEQLNLAHFAFMHSHPAQRADDGATPEERAPWLTNDPFLWDESTLDRERFRDAVNELIAHPAFDEARRVFSDDVTQTFASNAAVNRLMRRDGRFAFMAFVFYLHRTRDADDSASGVTYSRIAELFSSGALASPRRVKAMFVMARLSGHLRPREEQPDDRRVKVFEPTEALTESGLAWVRTYTGALGRLGLLPRNVHDLLASEGEAMLGEVFFCNVLAYLKSGFILYEDLPPVQAFMSRESGYTILMSLIQTMRRADDGSVHASAPNAELSERFALSRGSVRNMLVAASEEHWLQLLKRGGYAVVLSPEFAAACERWVALELEWMRGLLVAAAHTVRTRAHE
jgi:hypothetical protein